MLAGKLEIGLTVGCEYRWPMSANHPDCWMPPLKGVVLALDDPRAWAGSIAFPRHNPSQEECTKWVTHCLDRGLLKKTVPVLYGNEHEQFMQWDTVEKLRPWEEELGRWNVARKAAYKNRRELATAS